MMEPHRLSAIVALAAQWLEQQALSVVLCPAGNDEATTIHSLLHSWWCIRVLLSWAPAMSTLLLQRPLTCHTPSAPLQGVPPPPLGG